MPRPYKDDPRDCFKTFRFTAAELTRLEARAKARRQSLSAYVRANLLSSSSLDPLADPDPTPIAVAYAGNRNRPAPDEFPAPKGLRRRGSDGRILADQLRRVGTNLNQIAHRMNELRIPPPRELTMVLDEIRALVRQAREP